jgi:hypothetical protein
MKTKALFLVLGLTICVLSLGFLAEVIMAEEETLDLYTQSNIKSVKKRCKQYKDEIDKVYEIKASLLKDRPGLNELLEDWKADNNLIDKIEDFALKYLKDVGRTDIILKYMNYLDATFNEFLSKADRRNEYELMVRMIYFFVIRLGQMKEEVKEFINKRDRELQEVAQKIRKQHKEELEYELERKVQNLPSKFKVGEHYKIKAMLEAGKFDEKEPKPAGNKQPETKSEKKVVEPQTLPILPKKVEWEPATEKGKGVLADGTLAGERKNLNRGSNISDNYSDTKIDPNDPKEKEILERYKSKANNILPFWDERVQEAKDNPNLAKRYEKIKQEKADEIKQQFEKELASHRQWLKDRAKEEPIVSERIRGQTKKEREELKKYYPRTPEEQEIYESHEVARGWTYARYRFECVLAGRDQEKIKKLTEELIDQDKQDWKDYKAKIDSMREARRFRSLIGDTKSIIRDTYRFQYEKERESPIKPAAKPLPTEKPRQPEKAPGIKQGEIHQPMKAGLKSIRDTYRYQHEKEQESPKKPLSLPQFDPTQKTKKEVITETLPKELQDDPEARKIYADYYKWREIVNENYQYGLATITDPHSLDILKRVHQKNLAILAKGMKEALARLKARREGQAKAGIANSRAAQEILERYKKRLAVLEEEFQVEKVRLTDKPAELESLKAAHMEHLEHLDREMGRELKKLKIVRKEEGKVQHQGTAGGGSTE